MNSILKKLDRIAHSSWYWWFYILSGLASLAIALYFQYQRHELPCIMCIQVRMWVALFIIVCGVGLLTRQTKIPNLLMQFFVVLIATGLVDRSYQLLGTERGFIISDCGFSLGLPAWLALDKWFPWLFGVETSCGYTPVLAFGITMAEALMVLSLALLAGSLLVSLGSLLSMIINRGRK